MKALLFLVGIIIGIAICFWFFRKPGKAVNTTTVQVETVGKSFIYVQTGDVLKWTNAEGASLPVTFAFGSPCKEGNVTAICNIIATGGFFKYTCPTCLDPAVRVGSSGGGSFVAGRGPTPDTQAAKGATSTAQPPDPFVFCDANNNTATAQAVNAHVNDQIQWFPAAQIAQQNWQITVAPNVCRQGTVFTPPTPNQPTGLCTVLKADTYTVRADACQIPRGSAQITVSQGTNQQ